MFFDFGHDFVDVSFLPFFPRLEDDGEVAARLVGAHARAASRDVLHVFHGRVSHQVGDGPVGYFACPFERGAFGEFQLDLKIALVFHRKEAGGHDAVEDKNQSDDEAEIQDDPFGMSQYFLDIFQIKGVARGKPFVDFPEHDVFRFVRVGRFQYERAHDGAEGEGHHGGNQHGHDDGDGELAIELPGDAGQEADGDEHGGKHQGRGYQRPRQPVHGFLGGFISPDAFFFHDAFHVFHHDDGIVHHDADGKDKP